MTTRDRDDFPAQHIIPGGRENAIGVRFWREFYRNVRETIEEAIRASGAAQTAQNSAGAADTAAQSAQDAADVAQSAVVALQDELSQHVGAQATATDLGHVQQAGTPIAEATTASGPPPAAYDAAYLQSLGDRAEDSHARINDLIDKLRAAGIVA